MGLWLCVTVTLLLLAAQTPAEACQCSRQHLQTAFCSNNVVIKATFTLDQDRSVRGWIRYGIKTHQVFKGDASARNLNSVYTTNIYACEYSHSRQSSMELTSEYLITGKLKRGLLEVDSCSFIKPFSALTASQAKGLSGPYQEGCSCNIIPCFPTDCDRKSSKGCVWDEYSSRLTNQELNQKCVQAHGGSCTWQSI